MPRPLDTRLDRGETRRMAAATECGSDAIRRLRIWRAEAAMGAFMGLSAANIGRRFSSVLKPARAPKESCISLSIPRSSRVVPAIGARIGCRGDHLKEHSHAGASDHRRAAEQLRLGRPHRLRRKDVPYTLVPVMPHTPEVDAVHPLGKIPALRHGDVTLAKSRAICFYIDHAFDGPALVSRDPVEGAQNGAVDFDRQHAFRCAGGAPVRRAYFFPGTPDGSPNRPIIESALPKLEAQFAMLDRAVAKTGYLVGSSFTSPI